MNYFIKNNKFKLFILLLLTYFYSSFAYSASCSGPVITTYVDASSAYAASVAAGASGTGPYGGGIAAMKREDGAWLDYTKIDACQAYADLFDQNFTIYEWDYSVDGCPVDTMPDPVSGECVTACEPGSLDPDCAIYCPRLEYTYTLNGVPYRGVTGGGTVGYGQSCPEQSYPSDSGDWCIGSPGVCDEYDSSYNEGTPVTVEETTTTTSENPDGSSTTTTETTTTETTGSQDSTPSGSSDGSVIGTDGGPLTTDDYSGTVDIGGFTYGTCDHGGLVASYGGCDYPDHNCSSGQIDSIDGCIDLPDNDLPETPPTTVTVTDTDPDGNTTTTTFYSPGDDGVDGADGVSGSDGSDSEQPASSGSASGDCESPPTSSGDAQLAAIHLQLWNNRCMDQTSTTGDCDAVFTCEGDFFECEVLKRNHELDCAELDSEDLENQIETLASERGLTTTSDLDAAASEINFDEEVDVTELMAPLESVSTTAGSCPSDISISLGSLGSIDVPLSDLCTLFTWIGYLVRLSAAVVAFRMIFTTLQGV
jgi:hypothetical protein